MNIVNMSGQTRELSVKDTSIVRGIVMDAVTKQRIENVNVYLLQKGKGTVTNANGLFSIKIRKDDLDDDIILSHIGYTNQRITASQIMGWASG